MTDHPNRKMKEFVKNGCACGESFGAWVVQGPTFCKWDCCKCRKETAVYWD